ncbi:hypothetical protein S83_071012 [Arachis hypogaea]
MVGAMLGLHRSLQLAGLQLFLFLNLTDKYAWRVDYQQACGIEWDGEKIEFNNAPFYSEKNRGGGFLRRWFWV